MVPTYPELAGFAFNDSTDPSELFRVVPVAYDTENDRTLYAAVGTNFVQNTEKQTLTQVKLVSGLSDTQKSLMTAKLAAAGNKNIMESSSDGTSHRILMAGNGTNKVLILTFDAESRDDAFWINLTRSA